MSSTAHAAGSAAAMAWSADSAVPATVSAAASVKIGRSRLPPASTLYRIDSYRTRGYCGGMGRYRDSPSSTRARMAPMYSVSEAAGMLLLIFGEHRAGWLQIAPLVENLDALLGFLEPCVAEA